MHIVFVTHTFLPDTGSTANRVLEFARAWVAAGHSVTVITAAPQQRSDAARAARRIKLGVIDGITVIRHRLPGPGHGGASRRALTDRLLSSALRPLGPDKRAPDIVIATSPWHLAGAGRLSRSIGLTAPVLLDLDNLVPGGAASKRLGRMADRALAKADHVVVTTEAVSRAAVARGLGRDKISIVENGADLTTFDVPVNPIELRRIHGLTGSYVVLFAGQQRSDQRLDTLIEAAALTADDPTISWVIVGEGAGQKSLVDAVAARGLERVRFLDAVPRAVMPLIWSAADAVVVPLAANDPSGRLPSVLVEAMAMRRPVVIAGEGRAKDKVMAAQAGLAVTLGDPLAMATAVRTLFADPLGAAAFGHAGRQFVEVHANRAAEAERYLALLQRLLDPATAPARSALTVE